VEKCGAASDIDPSGKYLLALFYVGERAGVYEVLISERKCMPLLPGVATGYAVAFRGEVAISRYRLVLGLTD